MAFFLLPHLSHAFHRISVILYIVFWKTKYKQKGHKLYCNVDLVFRIDTEKGLRNISTAGKALVAFFFYV